MSPKKELLWGLWVTIFFGKRWQYQVNRVILVQPKFKGSLVPVWVVVKIEVFLGP